MAGFDYARPSATAARLIGRFGQPVTIKRQVTSTYDTDTSTATNATVTQTAMAVEDSYAAREIDGTAIRAGDRKLTVAPKTTTGAALVVPTPDDKVAIGGVDWSVIVVEPYSPGGKLLYVVLQLRKG